LSDAGRKAFGSAPVRASLLRRVSRCHEDSRRTHDTVRCEHGAIVESPTFVIAITAVIFGVLVVAALLVLILQG
jgi:hypothetical protein